jgi:hypothetical protein
LVVPKINTSPGSNHRGHVREITVELIHNVRNIIINFLEKNRIQ